MNGCKNKQQQATKKSFKKDLKKYWQSISSMRLYNWVVCKNKNLVNHFKTDYIEWTIQKNTLSVQVICMPSNYTQSAFFENII